LSKIVEKDTNVHKVQVCSPRGTKTKDQQTRPELC